jgi:hypothetical protein
VVVAAVVVVAQLPVLIRTAALRQIFVVEEAQEAPAAPVALQVVPGATQATPTGPALEILQGVAAQGYAIRGVTAPLLQAHVFREELRAVDAEARVGAIPLTKTVKLQA